MLKDSTEIRSRLQSKSRVTKLVFGVANLLYENINIYDHYGVEEYLASHGLSVDKKYRGRRIGDEFLKTRYANGYNFVTNKTFWFPEFNRRLVCQEFGIKVTHSMFSSDYSNKNAERTGYITDAEIKYVKDAFVCW